MACKFLHASNRQKQTDVIGIQDKSITIIHSRALLLNDTYPDKWRQQVVDNITARGVKLVMNDRVDDFEPKDGKITTRSGQSVPADLVVRSPLTSAGSNG